MRFMKMSKPRLFSKQATFNSLFMRFMVGYVFECQGCMPRLSILSS